MTPTRAPLTPEDVREGYQVWLDRAPENDALVEELTRHFSSREDFLRSLKSSAEFSDRVATPVIQRAVEPMLYSTSFPIEHQVSDEVLALMLERVRTQWTRLGENDPHWSVLSTPEFRREVMNADRIKELRASGRREAMLIDGFEARSGTTLPSGVCVELGCGVGRITRYLAERFEKVIALDISPGNLQLCADYMAEEGITNVETRLISSFSDFHDVPEYDVLFSVIVLQHNPPPVQRYILQSLLSRIRQGGGAVFQIPTHLPDYRFVAADYLSQPDPELEMHALPTAVVLEELRAHGLTLMEFAPDTFVGGLGSFTFFAQRL